MPETIVIKIGSSSIVDPETGFIALSNLSQLVERVAHLKRLHYKVVLVTSGAVGLGLRRMNILQRPKEVSKIQAAAAIGQGRLIGIYDELFSHFNQVIAQVLLTRYDVAQRGKYLNAKNTLKELLQMDVIPIINENDTVSIAEIRFGDNDTLSALVAGMVEAKWLFLLTDVDCLYTANPRTDPNAKAIHIVEDVEAIRESVNVSGTGTDLGTGGMQTKLIAASLATAVGCKTVIMKSSSPENILKILNGEEIGTVFKAKNNPMQDRKWWILHGLKSAGKLYVDDGAVKALKKKNSLFPAGISKVEGVFSSEMAVSILDSKGEEVAKGIVNYSSLEIDRIKGKKSSDIAPLIGYIEEECVIHRNNLVLK